jgi:hypothetical protein
MSKGSNRRPCQLTRAEEEQRWLDAFGPRPIPNVMLDVDRLELELREFDQVLGDEQEKRHDQDREIGGEVPADEYDGRYLHVEGIPIVAGGNESLLQGCAFWQGPGYRGEYTCLHGIGHGNHIHGCDGCCQRDDFPLKGVPSDES